MDSKLMDRRNFMGRIAISTGGGIAASVLPASLLHSDSCGDWKLDDICNACPGYAYDFRHAAGAQCAEVVGVADIDRMWVA